MTPFKTVPEPVIKSVNLSNGDVITSNDIGNGKFTHIVTGWQL
jgi:hypothetical protein